jgi:ubiquinone/menaquinone biosynthesis C-methylase UbiE
MTKPLNSSGRFTGRAENYARYRPGYPDAIIDLLRNKAGWREEAEVADIGAGTGISSELFLRHGNRVWAVEPNADMRSQTENLCACFPGLQVIAGTAESTTLPDACADFAVSGQAFHWFDVPSCRPEFLRILKPQGQAVLMWNKRQVDSSPFLAAYEDVLLRYGTDYRDHWGSDRRDLAALVTPFFGEDGFRTSSFRSDRHLDLEGLIGAVLSASYAPLPGHPNHDPMIAALGDLFSRFAHDGNVSIEFQTVVYWGRPAAGNAEERR